MKITSENALSTVVVTVDGAPDNVAIAVRHASAGLALFAEFDGFVGGATHVSADGGRIVQYLQWEDEEAHNICMNDPRWDNLESSRLFMALAERGELNIDVRIYRVAAISSGRNQD